MALTIIEGRQPPSIVQSRESGLNRPARWWDLKGSARAAAILQNVHQIESDQGGRRTLDMLYMGMYSAGNVAGIGLQAALRWQGSQQFRLRLNIAQMICDSLQAKIAKLRPRPKVLTNKGDWGLRKRAEAMELMFDGEFRRNDVDHLGPRIALDAFVVGTGFYAVDPWSGCGYPLIERAAPGEILVEYQDGLHQKPRTMYRARLVERWKELERAKAKRGSKLYDEIMRINSVETKLYPWLTLSQNREDNIYLIEAWHLGPPGEEEAGQYVRCAGAVELDSRPWECSHFPVVPVRWQDRQWGYFGRGAIEEIAPQQIEINYTLEKIQYILHNVSTVRHWVQAGGKIELNATRMTNTPGEILRFWGPNPPVTDVVQAVPPELFNHVDNLQEKAFAQVGMSSFFATADKPAGLNSGEAQRVYEDVGTERLIVKGRSYEECHIELADVLLDAKAIIAKDPAQKESPVRVTRKRARGITIESIKWADAEMDEDNRPYQLENLPQSALPGTPSGKLATVSEWLQMGLLTPEEAKGLLDFPDLKANLGLMMSTQDSVLSAIESMADEGEYWAPHPMLDIGKATALAMAAYTRLEWEGCADDRLELISRYVDALKELSSQAQPPAMPQAAAPQLAPGSAATAAQAVGM
jgi:hypothetical protein